VVAIDYTMPAEELKSWLK
jgi:hypothetical protein